MLCCPHCKHTFTLPAPTDQAEPRIVAELVARAYRLTPELLWSRDRSGQVREARQVAMWILRDLLELSSPAIAAAFNRDHTTVLWNIRAVEDRITTSPKTAVRCALLRAECEQAIGGNPQLTGAQRPV